MVQDQYRKTLLDTYNSTKKTYFISANLFSLDTASIYVVSTFIDKCFGTWSNCSEARKCSTRAQLHCLR